MRLLLVLGNTYVRVTVFHRYGYCVSTMASTSVSIFDLNFAMVKKL